VRPVRYEYNAESLRYAGGIKYTGGNGNAQAYRHAGGDGNAAAYRYAGGYGYAAAYGNAGAFRYNGYGGEYVE
jgi:hypothetical protein